MLIVHYVLWLILYSIAGWVYETILCSIQERKFVNRGFLNGPYCPIYGFGAILDILLIGWISNPVALFFVGMLVTCTLEYFTSWLLEVLFHAKWWDYSYMKFNIKGRVSLLGALIFGTFSVVLIKFIHPFALRVTSWFTDTEILIVTSALFALIVADSVYTLVHFSGFQKKLRYFQEYLEFTVQNSIEHVEMAMDQMGIANKANVRKAKAGVAKARREVEKVREQIEDSRPYIQLKELKEKMKSAAVRINFQEKRMLRAFPRFKSLPYNDVLLRIREYLRSLDDKDE
jgi:uncharacterized membrane protein